MQQKKIGPLNAVGQRTASHLLRLRMALIWFGVYVYVVRMVEYAQSGAAIMNKRVDFKGMCLLVLFGTLGWITALCAAPEFFVTSSSMRPVIQYIGLHNFIALFVMLAAVMATALFIPSRYEGCLPVFLFRVFACMVSGALWAFCLWVQNIAFFLTGAGAPSTWNYINAFLLAQAFAHAVVATNDYKVAQKLKRDGSGEGGSGHSVLPSLPVVA